MRDVRRSWFGYRGLFRFLSSTAAEPNWQRKPWKAKRRAPSANQYSDVDFSADGFNGIAGTLAGSVQDKNDVDSFIAG
jgi:hypothetical protein